MSETAIYLDNAATTPLDPRVLDAMLPWLREGFGNPSSVHAHGRRTRAAVEQARSHVAALLGADPAEIVFTSGGTESDNTAIMSVLRQVERESGTTPHDEASEHGEDRSAMVISSVAEHHAVHRPLHDAEQAGRRVAWLPVDDAGVPDLEQLPAHVGPATRMISLMHVNNETGGILPLERAAELARTHDLVLHSDMVQSAGKLPVDLHAIPVHFAAVTAHKLHGPKGVGALYVRGGTEVESIITGGSQERGRRGGTENVAGIVGFGEAARIALLEREERMQRWTEMRLQAVEMLRNAFAHVIVNGEGRAVMPSIISVSFPADRYPIDGEMLVMRCDLAGLSVSSGSACTAGSVAPSHVLHAVGHDDATAMASVRLSFGALTTGEEVRRGVEILVRVVQDMLEPSSRRSHSRMTMP